MMFRYKAVPRVLIHRSVYVYIFTFFSVNPGKRINYICSEGKLVIVESLPHPTN